MVIKVWLEPRIHWEIEGDKTGKIDWEMDHEVVYIQCQKISVTLTNRKVDIFHFFLDNESSKNSI